MLTPEQQARQNIDKQLFQAGWIVQDLKDFNPSASLGIAVREYPTESGAADYILFIDRKPVGVIEAKKETAAEKLVGAVVNAVVNISNKPKDDRAGRNTMIRELIKQHPKALEKLS